LAEGATSGAHEIGHFMPPVAVHGKWITMHRCVTGIAFLHEHTEGADAEIPLCARRLTRESGSQNRVVLFPASG